SELRSASAPRPIRQRRDPHGCSSCESCHQESRTLLKLAGDLLGPARRDGGGEGGTPTPLESYKVAASAENLRKLSALRGARSLRSRPSRRTAARRPRSSPAPAAAHRRG